jgi:hypothetical protein
MMNNRLKQATLSAVLCSVIILINTDLSCLGTYLAKRLQPLREHERVVHNIKPQIYTIVTPDAYLLSVKKDVYAGMSTWVHSTIKYITVVNNPPVSKGTDCRGSPSSRSP